MSGPIFLFMRIALSVALYAFVGWALYTVWKDLRKAGPARFPDYRVQSRRQNYRSGRFAVTVFVDARLFGASLETRQRQ